MLPLARELARCLSLANHEAKRLASARLEPEHLLLGLCAADAGLVPALRSHLQRELRTLRLQVEKLTREQRSDLVRDVLPPSATTKRLFIDAAGEARRRGQPEVLPEHLLLALLREDDVSVVVRALAGAGVDVRRVRQELSDALEWRAQPAPVAAVPTGEPTGVLWYEPHLPAPRRHFWSAAARDLAIATFAFMCVLGLFALAVLLLLQP